MSFLTKLWPRTGAEVAVPYPPFLEPRKRLTGDQTRNLASMVYALAHDANTRRDLALVIEKKFPDYAHSTFYDVFLEERLREEKAA